MYVGIKITFGDNFPYVASCRQEQRMRLDITNQSPMTDAHTVYSYALIISLSQVRSAGQGLSLWDGRHIPGYLKKKI